MAIRTRYSSLDMVRMAKFAKENTELKPIPLIKAYNEKYPEATDEQKLANIRNWLGTELCDRIEASNGCATLPIQRVTKAFCSCEPPMYNYPEMVWCDRCGLVIKEKQNDL